MLSTQAFAVDAMLPALPTITRALQVSNQNHGQWVVTAYVIGVGLGQLFWGLVSDRFGRRPVLLCGLAVYALAAVLCGLTQSFAALLGWRLAHGLAAASVVVTRSAIRDLYSGRQMARVMSLTFVVFLMVPIIAPSVGQLILLVVPWRSHPGRSPARAQQSRIRVLHAGHDRHVRRLARLCRHGAADLCAGI